jgi:DNA mismatch endonuclease, patch repair protein
MDTVNKEIRSKIMARIKSKGNKSTETKLRMILVRTGISGWKVQPKNISGNPDIVFLKLKIVIFVDGCFWHSCPICGHIPKSNQKYWINKLERNVNRDKHQRSKLRRDGWSVVRIWEHELKDLRKVTHKIKRYCK